MFEPLRCSRYHEGRSTPVTEAHNPNATDSPVEGGSPCSSASSASWLCRPRHPSDKSIDERRKLRDGSANSPSHHALALTVSVLVTVVGCAGGQSDSGNSQPHSSPRQDTTSAPRATDSALPERAPVTAEHRPARSKSRPSASTPTSSISDSIPMEHSRSHRMGRTQGGTPALPHPVRSDRQSSPATSTGKAPTGSSSICGISKQEPTSSSPAKTEVAQCSPLPVSNTSPKRTFPPTLYTATSTTPDSGSSRAVDPSTKPHAVTTTTSSHSPTWPNRLRRRSTPLRKSARTVGEQ